VASGETLRLFFGLPLPRDIAGGLAAWQSETFAGACGARMVNADGLHITLAFLGTRPALEVPSLVEALRHAARGIDTPVLTPARYRETERVAMLALDDEGGRAGLLHARLSERLERLGAYRPERRAWLPHVTVARFRARPRLRPPVPPLGAFSPSDAALYHSVLRPDGAQYSVVEAVSLGG
jgi:RNA 2',3'-cyclic 3'-phosphodiesterase